MNTTPNTAANGTTDLTAEIEYNCLAAWNRSEFGANQHDTVHPMYLTAFKSGYKAALAASAPVAPIEPDWRELCRRLYVDLFHCDKQMTRSRNEDGEPIWRTGTEVRDALSDAKAALEANTITREAAPVAPAPQPAGFVLVPVEPTQEMEDAAYRNSSTYGSGPGADYRAMLAAAPKVDHIADVSKMVPAPLQQGEYLPLPEPDTHCYDEDRQVDVWSYSASQVHAAIDADRAARGAAQAAPAEDDKWRSLALQFDSHRMQALSHLKLLLECGEDHADAVRTFLAGPPLDGESVLAQRIAAYAQPAPVAEGFDEWLEKQFEFRNYYFDLRGPGLMAVPFARRAYEAGRAQAAQPEGGNHG